MRQKRLRMLRKGRRQHEAASREGAEGEKPQEDKPTIRIKIRLLGDRAIITETSPDGTVETRENPYNEEARLGVDFINRCADAGYDIGEAWTGIDKGLLQILAQGYIPKHNEFYELTPEHYKKARHVFPHNHERLFMLLPRNPEFQKPAEVGVLTETQLGWFEKAAEVIECYCAYYDKHFDSEREKLAWLTTVLPPSFSEGTAARRNLLHVVK